MIVRWSYSISRYVSSQEAKIRYFWDLRNHLVHWFRLDNKHYIFVSDHALSQITSVHDELVKPQKIKDIFESWELFFADTDDSVNDTLSIMRTQKMNYLPVYASSKFLWVLWFQDMIGRLLDQKKIDTTHATISDVNVDRVIEHAHIAAGKSVYELEDLFEKSWPEVVLITENGWLHEDILWIVSVHELMGKNRIKKEKNTQLAK